MSLDELLAILEASVAAASALSEQRRKYQHLNIQTGQEGKECTLRSPLAAPSHVVSM